MLEGPQGGGEEGPAAEFQQIFGHVCFLSSQPATQSRILGREIQIFGFSNFAP